MQFPSLRKLADAALSVIKRFPFEILSVLTGTIAATVNVELKYIDRESENVFIRLMIAAELSLLLSFAATLYSEDKQLNQSKKLMLRLAAVFLAVVLFFLIHPGERQSDYVRFFLLALSFHLLVAFAAFTGKNRIHAFWQFNKSLFLRILTAALYSVVLFLGIAAAISAMNFLFGFKFEWDTYSILWFWIAGIFNTVFFLAGVPDNFEQLEQDHSYPKGLKLFTQYVLIPLASVYVLILLAYEIKILLEWDLPKGLVSNLILGYAVFGILSLLLVYPIRNLDENKWLKTYSRYFYFLLIPLLLLLFVAVGTRVSRYGVTENRYFLIALALWLFFITIYFLISKKQNIKLIPISLCVVTLLSIYGPQSAYGVAEVSQRQILLSIFKKYHTVFNGKISRMPNNVSVKDGNRAAATLQYLIRNHDFSSIQPLFSKNLETVSDSLGKEKNPNDHFKINNWELKEKKLEWAKAKLGLTKFSGYNYENDTQKVTLWLNITSTESEITNVKGYDYLININNIDSNSFVYDNIKFSKGQNIKNKEYSLKINQQQINFNADGIASVLLSPKFNLKKYLDQTNSNYQNYEVPSSNLSLKKFIAGYEITFQVSYLSIVKKKNTTEIQNLRGYYLIKKSN